MKSSLEDLHAPIVQIHRQPRHLKDADENDSDYEHFDGDMETSVTDSLRPKKKSKMSGSKEQTLAPAIPQRNEKRASKMLDAMLLEFTNLDGATDKDMETKSVLAEEDPHEKYLSSEEDASLSDDYEDSFLDTDMEDFEEDGEGSLDSRPSSRKSQEDTARVVSFMIVGKPQIVEIYLHSPTDRGRDSVRLDTLPSNTKTSSKSRTRRPSPLKLFKPEDHRRMSIASVASTATTKTTHAPTHSTSYIAPRPIPAATASPTNPRKTSRLASLKTSLSQHSHFMNHAGTALTATPPLHSPASHTQHSFLDMDPFEVAHYHSPTQEEHPVPKTPTGMTSAAWKNALSRGSLSRTLSKARKPSMPKINMTNNPIGGRKDAANASTTNLSIYSVDSGDYQINALQRRSVTMPVGVVIGEQQSQPSTGPSQRAAKTPSGPPVEQQRSGMFRMGLGRKKSMKT